MAELQSGLRAVLGRGRPPAGGAGRRGARPRGPSVNERRAGGEEPEQRGGAGSLPAAAACAQVRLPRAGSGAQRGAVPSQGAAGGAAAARELAPGPRRETWASCARVAARSRAGLRGRKPEARWPAGRRRALGLRAVPGCLLLGDSRPHRAPPRATVPNFIPLLQHERGTTAAVLVSCFSVCGAIRVFCCKTNLGQVEELPISSCALSYIILISESS